MSESTRECPRAVACLAVYNSAQFIKKTLEALAAQDYPNLEILISDDASTDHTARICQRFCENSRKFQLIRQSHRLGWVNNVNALFAKARGEYLLIIPHDDIVDPTYVTKLVKALEMNPRAILAFSDTKITFLNGNTPTRRPLIAKYGELDGVKEKLERAKRATRYQLTLSTSWPNVLTVAYRGVFRASAAHQIGGMRKNLAGEFGADWAWLLRLVLLGEFIRIPHVLVEKRRREGSLSSTWEYTAWQRFGEWAGCIVTAWRAGLSYVEVTKLQWWLLESGCLYFLKISKRRVGLLISRIRKLIGARVLPRY